jgi:hypothetical protein
MALVSSANLYRSLQELRAINNGGVQRARQASPPAERGGESQIGPCASAPLCCFSRQWPNSSPSCVDLEELHPIGVLEAFAPEPEVSTRITPESSVKYMFCPVVAAVIGVAVMV